MHGIRDRMSSHHRFPRMCPIVFLGSFPGDTSDRRWIKDDLGTLECNRARRFREPLIVTDQDGESSELRSIDTICSPSFEVLLLIEFRIIGNMDLAVGGKKMSAFVDDNRGIMQAPAFCPLVDRNNDDNLVLFGDGCENIRGFARYCLNKRSLAAFSPLRKVARAEELRQTNDACTSFCGPFNKSGRFGEIFLRVFGHLHLYETDRYGSIFHVSFS